MPETNAAHLSPQRADADGESILRAAIRLNGDPAVARDWYFREQIAIFDGKTPEQLVNEGRGADVLRYIELLRTGFAG